ncbi:MAG: hypothetical protein WAM46_14390 [Flavobacterium sp.]
MKESQVIYLIKEIAKENNFEKTLQVLNNSSFEFKVHQQYSYSDIFYNVTFKITPTVYVKLNADLKSVKETLRRLIKQVSQIYINEIILIPDYDKISTINSEVSIIETDWEEINNLQLKLVELSKQSDDSIDYQNIGNSSRILMDKLARIIFDPNLHKPDNPSIDISNGKFKNQLHTYIATKLQGNKNEDIRKLAKAAVEFMEKAIDLMNVTTHKLDVQKHFAELCIISTINVISVIKSISEIE